MKAYKATYNQKCKKQQYNVGKTYTADKMKMCEYGIHFCKEMEDVLNYYPYSKDFVLLEIDVLGAVEYKDNKGVTDKIKVLRILPLEEYNDKLKSSIPVYEYNSNGNQTKKIYPDGIVYQYEYCNITEE